MEQTTNRWHRHFDPVTVEQLRGLRLPAPRRSAGKLAGHRRNSRLGGSADFAQHRQYVPGDDLRLVDWKVFGRTDRYFLKQREDESNLVCHLAIDISGSMAYRSSQAPIDKLEAARRWASAVAFVALHQRDGVSLTTFDTEPTLVLPAAHVSPASIRLVAETLDRVSAGRETDLGNVLNSLAGRLPKHGLLIVVSDFLDDVESVCEGIRRLAQRDHQLVLVQVSDPAEEDLPWSGPVRLLGMEGESAIEIEPLAVRRAYRESRHRMLSALAETANQLAATWVLVRSDQPIGTQIRQWLAPQ